MCPAVAVLICAFRRLEWSGRSRDGEFVPAHGTSPCLVGCPGGGDSGRGSPGVHCAVRTRLTITTQDDRGREVALWQLPRWRSGGDSDVPEYVRARLQSDLAYAIRSTSIYMVVGLVCIQVVFMVVLFRFRVAPIRTMAGVQIIVMLVFIFIQQRFARGKTAKATRATLLAECHCASCGYDLLDVPVEPGSTDGCRVCPECQAAWRLDPAGSMRRSPAANVTAAATDIGEPTLPERGLGKPSPTIGQSLRWFLGLQRHHRWRGYLAGADDRGTIVELASPRIMVRPPRQWDSVPRGTQDRIRSRLWRLGLGFRMVMGLLGLPLIVLLMVFMIGSWRPGVTPVWTRVLPVVMYGFFGIMLIRFMRFPYVRRPREVVKVFLQEGRCASCATDLIREGADGAGRGGPEAAADGCTVCPTCHAAWRLSEAGPAK